MTSLNQGLDILVSIYTNKSSEYVIEKFKNAHSNFMSRWLTILVDLQQDKIDTAIQNFELCFQHLGFNILSEIARPSIALTLEFFPELLHKLSTKVTQLPEISLAKGNSLIAYFCYWAGSEYFSNFLQNFKKEDHFFPLLYALELYQQKKYDQATQTLLSVPTTSSSFYHDSLKATLFFELRNSHSEYFTELKLLSQQYPNCASIQYFWALAGSEAKMLNFSELEKLFSKIITLAPFFAEAYANWAVFLYEQKEYAKALEFLNQAILLNEKESSFFFNRGMIHLAQNQPTLAWKDFLQAYNQAFSIPKDALQDLMYALLNQNLILEAQEVLNFILTNFPTSPAEQFLRTQLWCLTGKWQEALEDLYTLQKLYPNEPKITWQLAYALEQLGKYTEALDYFLELEPLEQEFPDLKLHIAWCYLELEDFQNAQKYLDHSPYQLEYCLLQARLYEKQHQYDQGLEFLERIYPNFSDPAIIKMQVDLLLKLGNEEKALSILQKALQNHHQNQELLILQAEIAIEKGETVEAQKGLLQVLEINENNEQALHLLSILLAGRGEYRAAYEYYDRLLKLYPHDPVILANHANLAEMLGNYEQALADLDAAIKLLPQQAELYVRKAEIYKTLRNFEAEEQNRKIAATLQASFKNQFR